MKQVVLLVLFAIISSNAFSQVLKFRSYSFSIKYQERNTWSKWSEPEETSVLIVFNLDKERVSIFSKETQEYDIIETYKKVIDRDGDEVFRYVCIDKNGLRCNIRWIYLKSQTRWQVYVDYKDMMWMYNVNPLE